ncbi:MAG TPA: hypothetical protein ENN80_02025, partial [Candidatus Hydrogenedentes bacterium]|nr:hypothetical protein [Candidatus Hydrogenedentota bacterium]
MKRVCMILVAIGSVGLLTGCPPVVTPGVGAIALSSTSHDFGETESEHTLWVWNGAALSSILAIQVSSGAAWLEIDPTHTTSVGPGDRKPISITINRELLPNGRRQGTIELSAPRTQRRYFTVTATGVGMPNAPEIAVSADHYDFPENDTQWAFSVWNADDSGSVLEFEVVTNAHWLTVDPAAGTSTGPTDRKRIDVT